MQRSILPNPDPEDLSPEQSAHLSDLLGALSHPLRLRIVTLLCRGDLHVNLLAERLGVRQAAISQQLRILRMSGLLAVSRQGRHSVYRVAQPRLRDLVDCLRSCPLK